MIKDILNVFAYVFIPTSDRKWEWDQGNVDLENFPFGSLTSQALSLGKMLQSITYFPQERKKHKTKTSSTFSWSAAVFSFFPDLLM